ncbi:MAG: hypothetical protein ACP5OG_04155 [Candidatus Nanoarchaeia archaeon]
MENRLDMTETIKWYTKNKERLLNRILINSPNQSLNYPIIRSVDLELSDNEIYNLINLFPKSAQERSVLENILLKPSLWFHKNSIKERLEATNNITEAISANAIIPSYANNDKWRKTKIPSIDIELYQIPSLQVTDRDVRKIILSQGLIHEFAHTIISPAGYLKDYNLTLPSGKIIEGTNFINLFAETAEKIKPISHYASAYRVQDNKFKNSSQIRIDTSISEELAETITADLLGFAYSGDERSLNPFWDRPEIKDLIHDFLNAKLIRN